MGLPYFEIFFFEFAAEVEVDSAILAEFLAEVGVEMIDGVSGSLFYHFKCNKPERSQPNLLC